MGVIVKGKFNGTGAAVYICCGFVPEWVRLWAAEDTEGARAYWNEDMGAAASMEGFMYHGSAAVVDYAATEGIEPYHGGDLMTSTNQTSVTYGEGIYVQPDKSDYKTSATYGTINAWTLGSTSNRTGNWNVECDTTYVGVGSRIKIGERWYNIVALTSNGEQANEVTLDRAAPSGEVSFITGKYGYKPVPLGDVSKAGFKIAATTDINVNDETQVFEAGTYDC